VAELAHRAVERFSRIDIWVNNAGVYLPTCSARWR
jgi:NAD(P)-dependent dehydrogenase (short-subunit alcohol dehydrogenase family)